MKTLVNSYSFPLTTNDFDYKDELRPSAVLNYFQVVAGMHANEIGVGFDAFKERNLAWVLVKIKYKRLGKVNVDSTVNVKTWPKEPKRVEHDRFFQIIDCDNKVLFEGLSRWCVIDFETRRISRETSLYTGEFLNEEVDIIFDNDVIKNINIDQFEYMYDYVVRLDSLDHNGHMNNTRYGDIALSLCEKDKDIKELEINFVNESLLGDTIAVYKRELEDGRLMVIGFNETKNCHSFKVLVEYL